MLAFVNTLLTPACALLTWFVLDLIRGRKVTAIGAATAIIVGCVLITPAGGFISPGWAMVLGFLGALPCYAVIAWRPRTRVDETLDVLAAHGIAGFTGILFLGLVAQIGWNGVADGLFYGDAGQFWSQVVAAAVAPAYAFVVTFLLLKLVGAGDAAARQRARRGGRHGRRLPRRGGLRDGRGRDPRHARPRRREEWWPTRARAGTRRAMADHLQVLTTVASEEEAERIAAALVERRLAACVQTLGPIASTLPLAGQRRVRRGSGSAWPRPRRSRYDGGRGGDPRAPLI